MLRSIQIVLDASSHFQLIQYLLESSSLVKDVYNSSLFVLRQLFTSFSKSSLSLNEQIVVSNCQSLKVPPKLLNYYQLEKYMRMYHPDFFKSSLSSQIVQNCIRQASRDMTSFIRSLKEYNSNPNKFKSRPKLPQYCKKDTKSYFITNQDCRIRNDDLLFPKTKETLRIKLPSDFVRMKQVNVSRYFDTYKVCIVYEAVEKKRERPGNAIIGIDLGVNNFAAIVGTDESVLINGRVIKSRNQYFNKKKALYQSYLNEGVYTSRKLIHLSKKRHQWMKNALHTISRRIIKYCVEKKVGTIVVGKNKEWKQNVETGKKNNQNFVSIPHALFIRLLTYKANEEGIEVEESYTSKASFIDRDAFTKDTLTGKRIQRGLYQSKNGTIINADINGAANIIRKVFKDIEISKEALMNVRKVNYCY